MADRLSSLEKILQYYIQQVEKRKSADYSSIREQLFYPSVIDLLHAAIGLCTEAGELLDTLKKHIFYGSQLDIINVKEELGDLCFYLLLVINALNQMGEYITLEDILILNDEKLNKRYPKGFEKEKALNRDTEKELEHFDDSKRLIQNKDNLSYSAKHWLELVTKTYKK